MSQNFQHAFLPFLGWLPPTQRVTLFRLSENGQMEVEKDLISFIEAISWLVARDSHKAKSHLTPLLESASPESACFGELLLARLHFSEGRFKEGIQALYKSLDLGGSRAHYQEVLNLLVEYTLPHKLIPNVQKPALPEAIFIQLLTECNARCDFCPHPFTYHRGVVHPQTHMSDDTWDKILVDMIDEDYDGQVGFYLHHEPLLCKSLITKINDVNLLTKAHVVLSTNGALLTDSMIDKLSKFPPKKIHINISSGNKEQYERAMGLNFDKTMLRVKAAVEALKKIVSIEINCPVVPGVDRKHLRSLFPDVKINDEYEANSRGGLIDELSERQVKGRFNTINRCTQPTQNFNILADGAVIACCQDWMHESKQDLQNANDHNIFDIYRSPALAGLQKEFNEGTYDRYTMCDKCSREMGFFRKDFKQIPIVQV